VVVNYASNAKEADAAVAEIQIAGGQAIAVKADVGNAADVERLFEETVKAFGTVDVVVNNSGNHVMPSCSLRTFEGTHVLAVGILARRRRLYREARDEGFQLLLGKMAIIVVRAPNQLTRLGRLFPSR
jgi:NAD(P)-dependent dehydrogenase (short-subunit alcohol dehydrogenase family)